MLSLEADQIICSTMRTINSGEKDLRAEADLSQDLDSIKPPTNIFLYVEMKITGKWNILKGTKGNHIFCQHCNGA